MTSLRKILRSISSYRNNRQAMGIHRVKNPLSSGKPGALANTNDYPPHVDSGDLATDRVVVTVRQIYLAIRAANRRRKKEYFP